MDGDGGALAASRASGVASAAITKSGEPAKYYTVNLGSGRAKMKDKGTIGGGAGLAVRDIAVLP